MNKFYFGIGFILKNLVYVLTSIFAIYCFFNVINMPLMAKAFPMMFSVPVFVLSMFLLIKNLIAWRKQAPENEKFIRVNTRGFKVLGLFLLYVIVVNKIGFVVTSFVFLFCVMLLFGKNEAENRIKNLATNLFASIIIVAATYILFYVLVSIPLPKGILI